MDRNNLEKVDTEMSRIELNAAYLPYVIMSAASADTSLPHAACSTLLDALRLMATPGFDATGAGHYEIRETLTGKVVPIRPVGEFPNLVWAEGHGIDTQVSKGDGYPSLFPLQAEQFELDVMRP